MKHTLFLAWQSIHFHRIKTAILITSVCLTLFLPLTVHLLVGAFDRSIWRRAASTPLVLGRKGNRVDLVLHALYFQAQHPQPFPQGKAEAVDEDGLAIPIPLYIDFTARGYPVVGTTLDYFDFRHLILSEGHGLTRIGDCVIGAEVSESLQLHPNDRLMSDPQDVFNIAGSFPLNMKVAGVLAPTHSADDHAVFVDLKTSWIIAGIGHGHQQLNATQDPNILLKSTKTNLVANAALRQYTEITPANIDSFHFHARPEDLPLTALIAVPTDHKAETLLRGRYDPQSSSLQMLKPIRVIEEMLGLVMKIKRFFDANYLVVGVATGLFLLLVFSLSLRLRKTEMETLFYLGCQRAKMVQMVAAEILMIVASSLVISMVLAFISLRLAAQWLERIQI